MTNPTPSYDDLMTQLAAERLHNPWWTSVPKPTTTDDDVTCARRRRQLDTAYTTTQPREATN